jgi:glycosyltransferase involved in cell wall biosynthesis
MATKNGAKYVREQVQSILVQLSPTDEIVVSDDASSDETIEILVSFHDPRIRILSNKSAVGVSYNFERALRECRGEYIFLSDQDDVWMPNKIETMTKLLGRFAVVVCDCRIVDDSMLPKFKSFFKVNNSGSGVLRNIVRNSYIGCCMAFRHELLADALPFPAGIMHDLWIGLVCELRHSVKFIPEQLVLHRRHSANASTTGRKSNRGILSRLNYRYRIIRNLISHKRYAG